MLKDQEFCLSLSKARKRKKILLIMAVIPCFTLVFMFIVDNQILRIISLKKDARLNVCSV
jgi:hypothetical protein